MAAPPSSPPLARAFLALSDDGSPPEPRSPRRAAVAALTALALAVAVPLGWLAEHPVAVLSSKSVLIDDFDA
jgi:hypothetical protein